MEFFFFLISCCCFTCATFVISIINPIHSILLLILVFFFGSVLLLMLNIEFFAIVFLIVYVGAIAVLFLFIIMTLEIKNNNISQKFQDFFSYKSFIIICILFNIFIFLQEDYLFLEKDSLLFINYYIDYSKIIKIDTPLQILGKALFKEYNIAFLIAGFILFISMIGAIVITIEDFKYKEVKQQNSIIQAYKMHNNTIFNFKMYSNNLKKVF